MTIDQNDNPFRRGSIAMDNDEKLPSYKYSAAEELAALQRIETKTQDRIARMMPRPEAQGPGPVGQGERQAITEAEKMHESRAANSTMMTFRTGLADYIIEHCTHMLAVANRVKYGKEVTLPGEFQGIELGLQDFAAHVVKFKSVLIP